MYTVHIWLTNQCNMKCKYCYVDKEAESIRMDDETIWNTVRFVSSQIRTRKENNLKVHFHGGEPLLEFENLKKIVGYFKNDPDIKNASISYSMTTNGLLLDSSNIDFICDTINQLSVSIDGRECTHDRYRVRTDGSGTFVPVIEIVKELLSRNPLLRLRMTVNPDTVSELYKNVEFLVSLGGKYISYNLNYESTDWNEHHFEILENELKKISEYLLRLNDSSISIGMIIDGNTILSKKGKCGAGVNIVSIYANGDIYPCLLVTQNGEFKIGTVLEGIDPNKLEKIMRVNEQINPCCEGCSYYSYCKNTRCKIINKQETGDYLSPLPTRCAVENVIYRVMKYNAVLREVQKIGID